MPETFKRGRLASDPAKLARCLRLERYVDFDDLLPLVPLASSYASTQPWGMLGNDTVGDCTCAAAGHADQIAETYGDKMVVPVVTADEILSAYSAITGYNPDDPNSDTGANMLDVLRYWQKTGIAGEKITAYVAFDPTNADHWRAVNYLFGFAYVGVWLPQSVVNALPSIIDWTDESSPVVQQDGHCVITAGYDAAGPKPVTWGDEIKATWGFMSKRCDEAYAVLLPTWALGDPAGFDLAQLLADLKVVQGGAPLPAPTPAPIPPVPPTPPTPKPTPDPSVIKTWIADLEAFLKYLKGLLK